MHEATRLGEKDSLDDNPGKPSTYFILFCYVFSLGGAGDFWPSETAGFSTTVWAYVCVSECQSIWVQMRAEHCGG